MKFPRWWLAELTEDVQDAAFDLAMVWGEGRQDTDEERRFNEASERLSWALDQMCEPPPEEPKK